MDGAGNITNTITMNSVKYPIANMLFPNKTLILVTKRFLSSTSSNQQIALLAGMAFVGGIVAGLLIRCVYRGIVRYFMPNMDQMSVSQRSSRANANSSIVDDNFRHQNDEPPAYQTVVIENTINTTPQETYIKNDEERRDSKIPDEPPPAYVSIVSSFAKIVRSASR